MWLYLLIFFIPVLFYYLRLKSQSPLVFLACYLLFLAPFVGMSDMFGGYDRYIYCDLFDSLCDSKAFSVPLQDTALFMLYPSEFGYDMLNYAISFVTHNRYVFILIYTLIVYFLLYQSLNSG